MACSKLIPYSVWLFIDVIWYLGTAILVLSDVIFDILTCVNYYHEGWYISFILGVMFLVIPPAIIGIADFCEIDFISVGDEEAEASIEKRNRKKGKRRKGADEESRSRDLDEDGESRISAETRAYQFRPANEEEEEEALLKTSLCLNQGSPYPTRHRTSRTPSRLSSEGALSETSELMSAESGPSNVERRNSVEMENKAETTDVLLSEGALSEMSELMSAESGPSNVERRNSVEMESKTETTDIAVHRGDSREDGDVIVKIPGEYYNNSVEGSASVTVCSNNESNGQGEEGRDNPSAGRDVDFTVGSDGDSDTMDGKGTCRAPSYVYYRSGQLGSGDDIGTLKVVDGLARPDATASSSIATLEDEAEEHAGKAPNGEIKDETKETEDDTKCGCKETCGKILCNNVVHLFLNTFLMQCAVFARRFVLAHNFGKRFRDYVTGDVKERKFQRDNERKVNRGEVAYDLPENEVQKKYLDLKFEDDLLFRLWMMESLTESLPQLLINLYVIVKYQNNTYIQYISAILSFITLVWGVTSPEKYFREIQIIFHGRDHKTRTDSIQIFFIFVYKGLLLAARSLTLVYFTIAFHYYIILVIFLHWAIVFGRSLYFKLYRGIFNDVRYVRLITNSIFCIFLFFHVSNKKRIRGTMLQYYILYVVENITMILLWYFLGKGSSVYDTLVLVAVIGCTLLGVIIMAMYYTLIHKSRAYILNSYPVLEGCCMPFAPRKPKEMIVCKNLPTWINCYVKNEQALIPVEQDHIYIDQRVKPLEGQKFYFGPDTVFCARPEDIHATHPAESHDSDDDLNVCTRDKLWVAFTEANETRYAKKSDCLYDFIDNRGREVHVALDNFKWYRPQAPGRSYAYCTF
ncbi:uncharacterized protein [Ptychodera flava]|uniref:uncharacterized protein n=1 Tax=Ptychodera flava TaxID=63121 RepID=UPI00396A507A